MDAGSAPLPAPWRSLGCACCHRSSASLRSDTPSGRALHTKSSHIDAYPRITGHRPSSTTTPTARRSLSRRHRSRRPPQLHSVSPSVPTARRASPPPRPAVAVAVPEADRTRRATRTTSPSRPSTPRSATSKTTPTPTLKLRTAPPRRASASLAARAPSAPSRARRSCTRRAPCGSRLRG